MKSVTRLALIAAIGHLVIKIVHRFVYKIEDYFGIYYGCDISENRPFVESICYTIEIMFYLMLAYFFSNFIKN